MSTTVKKTKKNNRLIWWLAGAVVVLGGLAVAFGKKGNKGEKVVAEKVIRRTIQESVSASGRVFPEKEIKISSDVSGEIIEMLVKEGDSVKAGQLLCRVNAEIYKSQVARGEAGVSAAGAQYANAVSTIESVRGRQAQVQAQLEQSQATLDNARNSFKRNDQLHRDGIISDADFETAQSTFRQQEAALKAVQAQLNSSFTDINSQEKSADAAKFNLNSSEASLKELRTSLNKTSIYSPVDGIVTKRSVEKGERVVGTAQMSGTEILRVANLNAMEVQVNVSENDILRIAVGNEAEITVDAFPKRKFTGRLTEIANTAENAFTAAGAVNLTTDQATNFVAKIRIDAASYADLFRNGRPPFRPGMSGTVDIHTNIAQNALSVPLQAITTREEDALLKKAKTDDAQNLAVANKSGANKPVNEVIFVVSKDSVRMAKVTTGIQDNEFIQILSGVNEGEEIVSAPYSLIARKLKSGMKIQKVTEKELYKAALEKK